MWSPTSPRYENFELPNGMIIHIDYGHIFTEEDKFPTGYQPWSHRCCSEYRRSQLIDSNGNIISEVLEENPDYITDEDEKQLKKEKIIIGDEYEKIIKFPDGKLAKVEYWVTPTKRDKKCGRYYSKYRKSILFDKNDKIISEVMEKNPNYFDENIPILKDRTNIII